MRLTSKESADLAYKREVLRLAKERLADLAEVTANDGYHMPDQYDGDRPQQSKRYELLTQRYRRDCNPEAALVFHPRVNGTACGSPAFVSPAG